MKKSLVAPTFYYLLSPVIERNRIVETVAANVEFSDANMNSDMLNPSNIFVSPEALKSASKAEFRDSRRKPRQKDKVQF